jgi:NIMA (never in mitosis gene a)-related kinase
MKGLVLKILRGSYPPIPDNYSQNLKDLLADMLIKDPSKRPSMRKILEKDFLSQRITKLLDKTMTGTEFSTSFINKHLAPFLNKVRTTLFHISNLFLFYLFPLLDCIRSFIL